MAKGKKSKDKNLKKPMAKSADKHKLYEQSVQDTELEYKFINKTFRKMRNRHPQSLREDFCGTAKMCCQWIQGRPENTAVGVDLDEKVLEWGRQNNVSELTEEEQSRLTLLNEDVLKVTTPKVEVLAAYNFSYFIFTERGVMLDYFKKVRDALVDDGIFFLDAFGGYEAFQELEEKTKHKKFSYIWDQSYYNPITGDMKCYIHFEFPDGSAMRKAFRYEWRMWTLPEIQEILREAGFQKITVFWEGTDQETGEGNGIFKATTKGEADAGWIAYITAEK